MIKKTNIEDIDVEKKNIILRVDIDSSYMNHVFFEPDKIIRYKETFNHLVYNKAKIVVLFELGVNRVRYPGKYSVEEVINSISELLQIELNYFSGDDPKDLEYAIEEILPGEILFIENLALNDEDNKDSSNVFGKLEKWADYYVNDAFGVSARPYYSFEKLPDKIDSYSGILLSKEISKLADMLSNMKRPITLVMGGLNIDYFMIDQLLKLSEKVDNVLLTGAWVSYYLEELGEIEREDWMDKKVVKCFEKNLSKIIEKENIYFPPDVKVYKKYEDDSIKVANVPIDFIRQGLKIGDIGDSTLDQYEEIIEDSNFIIWIGNVGKWWKDGLDENTIALAEIISRSYSDKILVGDDLIESLIRLGQDMDRFTYVHYGDGETILRFLLKGKIIGVEKLKDPWNI